MVWYATGHRVIRACVVPYASGYAGVLVADDSTNPPRVVQAHTIPVGRLVPIPDALEGQPDKRREVTPDEIRTVAGFAAGILASAGAESVTIERSEGEISGQIGTAVEQVCADRGIATIRIEPRAWRSLAKSRTELAPLCARSFAGWPVLHVGAALLSWVGALWLAGRAGPVDASAVNVEGEKSHAVEVSAGRMQVRSDVREQRVPAARAEVRADVAILESGRSVDVSTGRAEPGAESSRSDPRLAYDVAPRRAGYDPGSAHPALVIGEGDTPPLRLIYRRTLAAGGKVPLAKPRTRTRPDGTTYVETHRHSVTADHVDAHAAEVMAILIEYGVAEIAIETVDFMHLENLAKGAASSIGTALHQSAWFARVIGERCRVAGIRVVLVTRQAWVGRVVKRVKGTKGGEQESQILPAIQAGFVGWPLESTEHERDAAGVLLYSVTPVPDGRRVRAKRPPRARAEPTQEELDAREARAQRKQARREREALHAISQEACICPPGRGRHRKECPCARLRTEPRCPSYEAYRARLAAAAG